MSCQHSRSSAYASSGIPLSSLSSFTRKAIEVLRNGSDQIRGFDLVEYCDPFPRCDQCGLTRENNILRSEVAYWKSVHKKAKASQAKLIEQNKELKARLRQRERMLFGRRSEKGRSKTQGPICSKKQARKRGQQPGAAGHGRRLHDNLVVKEEIHDLPEDQKCCPCCRLPFDPFPGTQDSELVEIQVNAHVRRIRRKQYKRTCSCHNIPAIITANGPDKLIPKGAYGDSVWVQVLLDKFLSYRPTYRFLESLKLLGLNISQGTITDGLKRLYPLFQPIYQEIVAKNQTENHWHADETRWPDFTHLQGKTRNPWYMWVFKSTSSVVSMMATTR